MRVRGCVCRNLTSKCSTRFGCAREQREQYRLGCERKSLLHSVHIISWDVVHRFGTSQSDSYVARFRPGLLYKICMLPIKANGPCMKQPRRGGLNAANGDELQPPASLHGAHTDVGVVTPTIVTIQNSWAEHHCRLNSEDRFLRDCLYHHAPTKVEAVRASQKPNMQRRNTTTCSVWCQPSRNVSAAVLLVSQVP